MKVPSSPGRRYLGGADWCVAALSAGTALTTGRRCMFLIAVHLDGAPDGARIGQAFQGFCARFPVLHGGPARCWCLAPYWRQPAASDPARPAPVGRMEQTQHADTADLLRHVERLINTRAARAGWMAALDIVQAGREQCLLLFSFDHVLFDADGAEAFIDLFIRHINGEAQEADFPPARLTEDARLDQWLDKLRSGQKVNRMMRRLAAGDTACLPLPDDAHRRPFRFRLMTFAPEESRRIEQKAFRVAGYLMLAPYLLATASEVFLPLFDGRGASDFVVSVSTDKPGTSRRIPHLFFNRLSFLYFQFPLGLANDRDALAAEVRNQLVAQVREGLPEAIEDANLLMRILPARLLWRFLLKVYRNRLSSFGFTCLGESAMRSTHLLGCPIRSRMHFPVIPAPPGLGLIFCRHHGVYHAVLSYIEGLVGESAIDALMARLRASLLAGGGNDAASAPSAPGGGAQPVTDERSSSSSGSTPG